MRRAVVSASTGRNEILARLAKSGAGAGSSAAAAAQATANTALTARTALQNRVVSPNTLTVPGNLTAPSLTTVAVIDITPLVSGLLICSFHLQPSTSAAEAAGGLVVAYGDLLTSITGGQLVAPGFTVATTGHPITAVASAAASTIDIAQADTAAAGPLNLEVTCPIQAVVGHRTAVILKANSFSGINWTFSGSSGGITASVFELP